MRTVCLLDTSILTELFKVPGKSKPDRHEALRVEMQGRAEKRWEFLVPWTVILETGNHIGQCSPHGDVRRKTAQRFCAGVLQAIDGQAPWTPTHPISMDDIRRAIEGFVEHATMTHPDGKGSGIGDLTLIHTFERTQRLHPTRRVLIWSLDGQLVGYDSHPGE